MTGAGGGIGAAISHPLARDGFQVFAVDISSAVERVVDNIREAHDSAGKSLGGTIGL